jgi:hypothetical protein
MTDMNSVNSAKNAKLIKPHFARRPDEQARFRYLVHLLVRVKSKTGRSSGEVVNAVLTKGKDEINWTMPSGL